MFGILAWQGALMCWDDYRSGLTSPGLGLPQWWYTLAVPVLSALIVLRLLQRLVRLWNVA
jgi:TRAP-type C4-dicarboxylate transport system permease small subunit